MLIDFHVLQCYTFIMIRLKNLIWDEFNLSHIARHAVTRDEVKEASLSDHITLETYGGRILLIGVTKAGRVLSIVLSAKGDDTYYPITARDASRKERRYYNQIKGGEQAA